ncbi:MAG: GntR family transcriptional regulator [Victivallaceae bacterium]
MTKHKLCKSAVLTDMLEEKIIRGVFPPGSDFPTMDMLMREHNISIVTANKILKELNTRGLIDVRRGRKTKIPFRGTVFPQLSKPIGIVNPMPQPYRLAKWRDELLQEIQRMILAHGNRSLWLPADFALDNVIDRCSGLIYSSEQIPPEQWDVLLKSETPCARITFERPHPNCIFIDYRPAIDQVLMHVVSSGCENIIFLYSSEEECSGGKIWYKENMRFLDTLEPYCINETRIHYLVINPEDFGSEAEFTEIMRGITGKTAILGTCCNYNPMVINAMTALNREIHKDYEIYALSFVGAPMPSVNNVDIRYSLIAEKMIDMFYENCITRTIQSGRTLQAEFIPRLNATQ